MGCPANTNLYLPARIAAGLSFEATVSLADYPASEWTLVAVLRGPAVIDLTATPLTDDHLFSEDGDETADWTPGLYAWELRASKAGKTFRAASGQLLIEGDLAQAEAGADPRTENQKALDAIKAVLAKRATLDQERYRINNRELYRTSISDLLKLKAYYVQAVKNECGKTGSGRFGRKVPVTFS